MPFVATAAPDVMVALYTGLNAGKGQPGGVASNVTIQYGAWRPTNVSNFLMIGADDPDESIVQGAVTNQGWAHSTGTARDDEGDVICCAMAWNGDQGDVGAKKALDDAVAIATAVGTFCLADYTLGLAELSWALFGGQLGIQFRQEDSGVTAVLTFRIHYKARI